MKIPCTIIDDLIPLFIDGACSSDTKGAVEEHLSECDNCRLKYQNMITILLPEETEPPIPKKEITFNSKKAFKRIRRRLAAAIICVLLIIPITFLSVNQYKKEGICFTNLYDIYRANAFLKALKAKNYEKAFSYLDIAWEYDLLIEEPDMFSPEDEFTMVEINGATYYVDKPVLLNNYAQYTSDTSNETKDKLANFWISAFQHSNRDPILIPEEVYLENQDTFIELNESYRDSMTTNTYKSFVLLELESGSYYYFSDLSNDNLNQSRTSDDIMKFLSVPEMSILPADVYSYALKVYETSKEEFNIFRNKCEDMGYETYYENCKKAFLENMNQLKERGISIDYSFNDSYQTDYAFKLNYNLLLTVNDKTFRGIGITFSSTHNNIRLSGGFHTPSIDPLFNELHDLVSNAFYIRGIDFYVNDAD